MHASLKTYTYGIPTVYFCICLIQVRDIELELDEERRRHAETTKILRKKERQVKEIIIQGEEDHKNVALLNDSVEKLTQKLNVYKLQLQEQVSWTT